MIRRKVPFQQVDVFTAVPFKGNPVAVVLEGDGLSTEEAQAIARWTNLSETTFVCSAEHPEADYRLRIFTPRSELPFAGHPTLGSAHAALRAGLKPKRDGCLVQECGKGLVQVQVNGSRLSFELPKPVFGDRTEQHTSGVAEALGIHPSDILRAGIIDVGPVWFTAQLRDAAFVTGLKPDMARISGLAPSGVLGVTVFGLYPAGAPAQVEVRSFAPHDGVPEDPVCGSGNGCVAALIQDQKILGVSEYVASQGSALGRDGRVHVRFSGDGAVWVGGDAITCVEGTLTI